MRVKVLGAGEVRFSSGEAFRLLEGQTLELSDDVATELIRKTQGRVVIVPDADLTPVGERWRQGWVTVVGLPRISSNDHREWARDTTIEECDRQFERGNLVCFELAVQKLRALMRERW